MAGPIEIDASREIPAPVDAVWAVLVDLRRLPEWLAFASELEEASGDQVVVGAGYKVKPHRSYEPTTEWRVEEVEAPRRQVHTSEMPMISGVRSTIELSAEPGDRTRVRVHWRGDPSTLPARLMRGMFQRRIQRNWEHSLEQLERLVSSPG